MTRGTPGSVVGTPSAGTATPRHLSIRWSLLALVVACLTPALLVSSYLIHQNYAEHHARVEHDLVLQARGLVAALDRELSGVVAGLRVLSTSPSLDAGNLSDFHERARGALAFQIVDNYVLTDRQGRQHLNTLRDFGTPLPRTGTPSEVQRVFETGRPVLTGFFVGAVTGKPIIAMSVPVFRDSEVVYSLNAGISPARIAEILQRRAIPSDWVAAVLDGSATIVARTRDPQTFVGQKATPDLIERLDSPELEGLLKSRSKEGIPTYAGFARSTVSNWSVVVGAPRATVEAGLYQSITWLVLGAAAAFAVGIAFAVRLSGRVSGSIRRLVEPALALGSGLPVEQCPPTLLKETDAVAQAIVHAGRMLQATRHLAEHDALTGLPNRLLFAELAGNRLAEARRRGDSLALLAIALDGFKAVNDVHGHAAGDAVLKAAAARISGALRESDVVARMGGDEFVVLLSEAGLDDARLVGAKLVEALSTPYPDVKPAVSGSVGIALHPQDGNTVNALCDRADQALYEAKRSGKKRLVLFP